MPAGLDPGTTHGDWWVPKENPVREKELGTDCGRAAVRLCSPEKDWCGGEGWKCRWTGLAEEEL